METFRTFKQTNKPMKELPKILELLSALRQAKLGLSQEPMPGPCPPGEKQGKEPAAEEMEAAIERYHATLSLWAIGFYYDRAAPPQVQQLVNRFLLGASHIAPCGFFNSEATIIDALQQQLQAFIDRWLEIYIEK